MILSTGPQEGEEGRVSQIDCHYTRQDQDSTDLRRDEDDIAFKERQYVLISNDGI